MLILSSNTQKLQIRTYVAPTSTQLTFFTSYIDRTIANTQVAELSTIGVTTGTTLIDLVPSPTATKKRLVKQISIYNADTVRAIVEIVNESGLVIKKQSIATGQTLTYNDDYGWNSPDTGEGTIVSTTTTQVPTGAIDNANLVFNFTDTPMMVVVNGISYKEGSGYTRSGNTVTLTNPVGTGGDIFGIVTLTTPLNPTIMTPTGAVDNTNLTFTFTSPPKIVVINGASYISTSMVGGILAYTIAGNTITTQFPVGTGGVIYGIS